MSKKKKKPTPRCPVPECGKYFLTREQLSYHYRESHGESLPQEQETEMAKTTPVKSTPDGQLDTTVDPKTQTVDLPHIDSTSNFEVFGRAFERGGQEKNVAGKLYIPKDIAKDTKYLRVTLMKS